MGLHHSSGKHLHSSHPAISSTSSSPNSDLKLITMSLAKESESGTLGISIIGGKVSWLKLTLLTLIYRTCINSHRTLVAMAISEYL